MNKVWDWFLNLFPVWCNDCGVRDKRNNLVIMATFNARPYYKGKGICEKCADKRMYEALEQHQESDDE